jgi:hypothetical protein
MLFQRKSAKKTLVAAAPSDQVVHGLDVCSCILKFSPNSIWNINELPILKVVKILPQAGCLPLCCPLGQVRRNDSAWTPHRCNRDEEVRLEFGIYFV